MPRKRNPETLTPIADQLDDDDDDIERDDANALELGRRAERQRVGEIRALCAVHPSLRQLELDLVDDGTDIAEARRQALEILRRENSTVPTQRRLGVELDEREKFRRDAVDGLLIRAGSLRDPKREAEITHFSSLVELARECCRRAHIPTAGCRVPELVSRALSHSTSDFPYLLESAAGKALLQAYEQAPATWKPLAARRTASDFRPLTSARFSEAADLIIMPELAPYPESSFNEAREQYKISTYAQRIGISRQAITNDDLSAFDRVPQAHGAAASRLVNSLFWGIINTGQTMAEDSVALFATTHPSGSNLPTGAALSTASLGAAMALMRRQKGFGANKALLNIAPRFLAVPPELEVAGLELLTSTTKPGAEVTSNVLAGRLELIVEPLQGDNAQGVHFGCYIDVAAKAVDHRGVLRGN